MSAAIGHVGPNLPQRLLRATGRHAGPLDFEPDRPTPRADVWMENKFAPWAKSILQAWADGAYDDLDEVVFSRAEDSVQRLYYYLCELQRRGMVAGPTPLILDIAKVPRATSLERTAFALRRLADRWGVDEAALRAADPAPVAAAESAGAHNVCLLAGTSPPDRRLHDSIASAGFAPHGATLRETWLALDDPLPDAHGDAFDQLAQQVHTSPHGPRAFVDTGAELAKSIATSGARAVVLWIIEEDEAQSWHLPAQRKTLEACGVPYLVLTRRDWLAGDGAGSEIAAFLSKVNP
ncbi:hypothetical protein [Tsuneonella sp. HG222]